MRWIPSAGPSHSYAIGLGLSVGVLAAAAVLSALSTPAVAAPYGYMPMSQGNVVEVFDTVTNTVAARIPVPRFPCGIAMNPSRTRAYVPNCFSGAVSVIDTGTNTVTATLQLDSLNSPLPRACWFPTGVAVHPADKFLYVAGFGVKVYDLAANKVVKFLAGGCALAIDPTGAFLYVEDFDRVLV